MAAEKLPPKWNENRVQHVYGRRDSGGYYVQGYREGKEIWKALGTAPPTLFVRKRQRLSFQLAGPELGIAFTDDCSQGNDEEAAEQRFGLDCSRFLGNS